jgi:hypothetical protein
MDEMTLQEEVSARVSTFTNSPTPIETEISVAAKRLIRERSEWPISAATLRIVSAYRCFATVDPSVLPDSAFVAYELACQSLCATLVALEEIISLLD